MLIASHSSAPSHAAHAMLDAWLQCSLAKHAVTMGQRPQQGAAHISSPNLMPILPHTFPFLSFQPASHATDAVCCRQLPCQGYAPCHMAVPQPMACSLTAQPPWPTVLASLPALFCCCCCAWRNMRSVPTATLCSINKDTVACAAQGAMCIQ